MRRPLFPSKVEILEYSFSNKLVFPSFWEVAVCRVQAAQRKFMWCLAFRPTRVLNVRHLCLTCEHCGVVAFLRATCFSASFFFLSFFAINPSHPTLQINLRCWFEFFSFVWKEVDVWCLRQPNPRSCGASYSGPLVYSLSVTLVCDEHCGVVAWRAICFSLFCNQPFSSNFADRCGVFQVDALGTSICPATLHFSASVAVPIASALGILRCHGTLDISNPCGFVRTIVFE